MFAARPLDAARGKQEESVDQNTRKDNTRVLERLSD